MDGAGQDQSGPLHAFDGINVLLHERFERGVVEAVRGCEHDVEAGVLDRQGARTRDGVQQVEGGVFLALQVEAPQPE